MSTSVTMPALGESVTEGTVIRWLKQEGDEVAADEPLLEVSTDKVDTEIPSPAAGVLQRIVVGEDETVAVGAELAVIGDGQAGGGEQQGTQQEQPQQAQEQEQPQQDQGGQQQEGQQDQQQSEQPDQQQSEQPDQQQPEQQDQQQGQQQAEQASQQTEQPQQQAE